MNPKYFIPILLVISFFFSPLQAQKIDFLGEANLKAMASTEERLPFWMYHNTRGRITENSNLAAWVSGRAIYKLTENAFLEAGAGFLYRDGALDNFFVDELYARFENSWMHITAGRKQKKELYNGLSSSNRSILWSLNARPLPGIQIGTTGPIFLFSNNKGLGFEASWEEYWMGTDRYVENTRLHHKNFLLVYRFNSGLQVKAGIQHFVQWAGTHPRFGEQPHTFNDYLRIITGQEGTETATAGDELNALGNHLGGYEIYVSKTFEDFYIQLFYNHLFEDGSGQRWRNKIDGRYGIFIKSRNKAQFINSAIFEFYYTMHQSHTINAEHLWDNYFNNGVYSSGWTYHGRVIGSPFFTPAADGIGIINNKFRAYHLGIGGQLLHAENPLPYKLMLSYSYNGGLPPHSFDTNQKVFYADYKMKVWQKFVEVNLQLGAEFNSFLDSPIFGAGIHLRKRF